MRFAISQNVMGLPAVHLFSKGTKVFEISGSIDMQKLEEKIIEAVE